MGASMALQNEHTVMNIGVHIDGHCHRHGLVVDDDARDDDSACQCELLYS